MKAAAATLPRIVEKRFEDKLESMKAGLLFLASLVLSEEKQKDDLQSLRELLGGGK